MTTKTASKIGEMAIKDAVVLLVSRYDSKATRRAARVLQNYNQYSLDGAEIEVTGTDDFETINVKKIK